VEVVEQQIKSIKEQEELVEQVEVEMEEVELLEIQQVVLVQRILAVEVVLVEEEDQLEMQVEKVLLY
jgi:hypothetical protein